MPAWNFPPLFIPINVLTLILATHFSGQQEEKISTRGTEDKLDYPTPNGSLFKKNFSIHFFFPPNCSKLASSSLQKLTLSGFKIPTIIERDLDLQRGSSSLARCTWKTHHNDVILALSSLWSTRGEAVSQKNIHSQLCWCKPITPVLGRLRKVATEFKTSLGYRTL